MNSAFTIEVSLQQCNPGKVLRAKLLRAPEVNRRSLWSGTLLLLLKYKLFKVGSGCFLNCIELLKSLFLQPPAALSKMIWLHFPYIKVRFVSQHGCFPLCLNRLFSSHTSTKTLPPPRFVTVLFCPQLGGSGRTQGQLWAQILGG